MADRAAPAGGLPAPGEDLCALLKQAASQLDVNELLAPDEFDLFAVMNAAVIGDPRLDAGAGHVPDSPDASAPADLSLADALAVMDALAAMEATWHSGQPLAQTIYTCHYLIDPQRISHLVSLKAFCTSLRVTTRLISDLCYDTRVARDEDFLPHLCGFTQAQGQADAPAAVEELERAEARLERLQKARMKADAPDAPEAALAGPLLCRLRFRRILLQALMRLLSGSPQQLELARRLLAAAEQELDQVQASAGAGAQGAAPGFDPDANRHMMGPAPPRAVRPLPLEQAWEYYGTLLAQLQGVCSVTEVKHWWELKEFMEVFASVRACAVARMAMAAVLALHDAAPGSSNAWVPSANMLRGSLGLPRAGSAHACEAAEAFLEQAVQHARDWAHGRCLSRARQRRWQKQAVLGWNDLVQAGYEVEASEDFQALAAAAERKWDRMGEEDEFNSPIPGPLSAWAGREACLDLQQHLALGFELNLYQPEEYGMIFWYYDFLLQCEVQQAMMLREWLHNGAGCTTHPTPEGQIAVKIKDRERERGRERGGGGGGGASGRKRERGARVSQADVTEHNRWASEAALILCEGLLNAPQRLVCQGTMRLACALRCLRLTPDAFPKGQAAYSSEEQLFEQRFHCFSAATIPPPLSYGDYVVGMSMENVDHLSLLEAARSSFREAVEYFKTRSLPTFKDDHAPRQAALERLAKCNKLAVEMLSSLLPQPSEVERRVLRGLGSAYHIMPPEPLARANVQTDWQWGEGLPFPRLAVASRRPGA